MYKSFETTVFENPRYIKLAEQLGSRFIDNGLKYGWPSHNKKNYDFGHWNKLFLSYNNIHPIDFSSTPHINYYPEVAEIWSDVQSRISTPRILVEAYINGYTYGTDAYAHQDKTAGITSVNDGHSAESILVYLNNYWHMDWAGETVIFDDQGDIEKSVLPKPGRVLMFNSLKLHCARPVARACPELRSVLVLKVISAELESKVARWLCNETASIQHGKKTFFEHLYNTGLLVSNKAHKDVDVNSAAMFHAVYGTQSFKYNGGYSRDFIRSMIGERAEYLAYEFGHLTNRAHSLLYNTNQYDEKTIDDLTIIEWANMNEQGYDSRSYHYIEELNKRVKSISEKRNYPVPRKHKLKTYDFTLEK